MENLQNIIILFLVLYIILMYAHQKNLKYWKNYYQKNFFDTQDKLNEVIFKQELSTKIRNENSRKSK